MEDLITGVRWGHLIKKVLVAQPLAQGGWASAQPLLSRS